MNPGTIFVIIVLVVVVSLIIWSMIKKKRAGKSIICNCGTCSGNCKECMEKKKNI